MIAAFKELDHVVEAPGGGDGHRVSLILQQNKFVTKGAWLESDGGWVMTAVEKDELVKEGLLDKIRATEEPWLEGKDEPYKEHESPPTRINPSRHKKGEIL